ncbi:hypothetical protein ACA910_022196 [Epithemia clementina (nom. ined.)]
MKEIKLLLVPQPGAKPEFLAALQVVDPSPAGAKTWNELPAELVLEQYTRDGWAWKPNTSAYQTLIVESTDGRNKLPGFVKYLQQRQKASYGRFGSKGVWVISYVQQPQPNNPNRMECRIALDFSKIPECSLQPRQVQAKKPPPGSTTATASSSSVRKKGSGTGLLGKLVAGQIRTNQHVIIASTTTSRSRSQSAPSTAAAAATAPITADDDDVPSASGEINAEGTMGASMAMANMNGAGAGTKTAMQIMNEFRQAMEAKMLDFDESPDQELRVTLSLPEYTANLSDAEKPKITMEILKYMVYEAAEEVNEEWVAHKEPSEFMDEAVLCVYKEGAAPPEVLEELNKGEMPDEVKGQQRAIQEERMKQMNQAEQRKANALLSQAHNWQGDDADDEVATLNQNKRDRRSVAEYERDKKRGKPS